MKYIILGFTILYIFTPTYDQLQSPLLPLIALSCGLIIISYGVRKLV